MRIEEAQLGRRVRLRPAVARAMEEQGQVVTHTRAGAYMTVLDTRTTAELLMNGGQVESVDQFTGAIEVVVAGARRVGLHAELVEPVGPPAGTGFLREAPAVDSYRARLFVGRGSQVPVDVNFDGRVVRAMRDMPVPDVLREIVAMLQHELGRVDLSPRVALPRIPVLARAIWDNDNAVLAFLHTVADHKVGVEDHSTERWQRAKQIAWDRDERGWRSAATEKAEQLCCSLNLALK